MPGDGGITFSGWIKIGAVLALCLGGVVAANTAQGSGELALKAADPLLALGDGGRRRGSRRHGKYSDDVFWATAGQKVMVEYDAAALAPSGQADLSIERWASGPNLAQTQIEGPSAGSIEATVKKDGLHRVKLKIDRRSYVEMTGRMDVRWRLQ